MNTKKFFGAAITTLFAFASVATAANFSNSSVARTSSYNFDAQKRDGAHRLASSFADSIDIGRDELTVDVTSLTSTPESNSATISFASVRLTGWAPTKKNVYVVIDDPDYSGSTTSPSLSDKTNPVFAGYTIEMANEATFTMEYTEDGVKHSDKDLLIPTHLTYGNSFTVLNKKILTDSFIWKASTTPKFDYLVIPTGIETIESKAIQGLPESVKIRCEDAAKPAGWADDWCDAPSTQIEWGYELKGDSFRRTNNEVTNKTQSIGTNTKNYGDLMNAASNGVTYALVDDANWTGDYDNPVRSTAGRSEPYSLNSYVYRVDNNSSEITIPVEMTYGSKLVLKNTRIEAKSLEYNSESPLTKVYIPKGIETIETKAFSGFNNSESTVEFYCEDSSKPFDWSEGWTDAPTAKIHWGATIPSGKSATITSTDTKVRANNAATTYILGYKYTQQDKYYSVDEDAYFTADELVNGKTPSGHAVTLLKDVRPELNLPLTVSYEIRSESGALLREEVKELPLSSEEATSTSTDPYDQVRSESFSREFDILLDEGEVFDATSVRVYNIYRLKSVKLLTSVVEEGTDGKKSVVEKYQTYRIPDTSVSFKALASKRFDKKIDINQIINYRFAGLTKFFNYSMVAMTIDKKLPSYWFDAISEEIYDSYKTNIQNGTFVVRYGIYNIANSFYQLTYYSPTKGTDVTVTTKIKTPNPVVILEKDVGNRVSFLIKDSDITYKDGNKTVSDFKIENLKRFEIVGFTLNIHLWDNEKSVKVGRTDLSVHFGAIDVMPTQQTQPQIYNVFTFILVFELILLAVYAGGAVALFFYLREKFKNDEFRRMKPKAYLKTAILGYLGTLIISVTILFIIFRGGLFMNAVSTHNPLDLFIVIPGVISIVVIGYFIKFMVGKIKANKQRKVAKKLKLNEDADDDGTK